MEKSPGGGLSSKRNAPFGLMIEGDLREPLSPQDREWFRDRFYANGLFIARGQNLSLEQQIRVIEYIGPVVRGRDLVGFVSTDSKKGTLGTGPLSFHSDMAWVPSPQKVGSLHAVEVSDGKTSTLFANSQRAYAALPAALRSELEGLIALQAYSPDLPIDQAAIGQELREALPHARHPLVLIHPVTGAPILYMSYKDTIAFEGLSRARMMSLAETLFAYLYDRTNIYEHPWHSGDLVIWDNLALQHARGDVGHTGPRTLQRVGINEKSLADQDPRFYQVNPEIEAYVDLSRGDRGIPQTRTAPD